ncbi:MAG: hypothetical protein DMF21_06805 [Verrucomicrobia bacterium]|nr:MAG: hypothetical protein DMF21_06805 [Verrucomicrobiota bacterium]
MRFVVLKASSSIHLAHRCPSDHLADTTQGSLAINRLGPNRASGEVKLDCGKDTNWLLFDPKELQRFAHQKGGIMKKTILTLACLLVAPLAFAQTGSTHKRQTTTAIEQPITVTAPIITTTEEGSAAIYQPFKTLVVSKDTPGSYVLNGPGHVVNNYGEVIRTAIKPGTHVRVYYVNTGGLRMVDHVVVD